jgi:hypothetical protein
LAILNCLAEKSGSFPSPATRYRQKRSILIVLWNSNRMAVKTNRKTPNPTPTDSGFNSLQFRNLGANGQQLMKGGSTWHRIGTPHSCGK